MQYFLSRLCLLNPVCRSQFNRSVVPNPIEVTQFNQMAFWFFLGLLDRCRKQLEPKKKKIPALETMLLGFLDCWTVAGNS
jgi:hypothetical protein